MKNPSGQHSESLIIEVTQEAAEQFASKLKKRGSGSIRFGVKGGACNGFAYQISFEDDEPKESDTVWVQENVRFIVDRKSLIYFKGTKVVWRSSLLWSGFDFENPREASRCGCGESFSVK